MYTTMALVFALGVFADQTAPIASEPSPRWLSDYAEARKIGFRYGRPLAVFVGSGEQGFNKVSQDGPLSAKARGLLSRSYVCVYLDTTQPAARRLVDALQITRGCGLILSDRFGEIQVFHHDGDLSEAELARNLERCAGGYPVVPVAEAIARPSYYSPPPSVAQPYVPVFRGGSRNC